jgi:hypothetical protein
MADKTADSNSAPHVTLKLHGLPLEAPALPRVFRAGDALPLHRVPASSALAASEGSQ